VAGDGVENACSAASVTFATAYAAALRTRERHLVEVTGASNLTHEKLGFTGSVVHDVATDFNRSPNGI